MVKLYWIHRNKIFPFGSISFFFVRFEGTYGDPSDFRFVYLKNITVVYCHLKSNAKSLILYWNRLILYIQIEMYRIRESQKISAMYYNEMVTFTCFRAVCE